MTKALLIAVAAAFALAACGQDDSGKKAAGSTGSTAAPAPSTPAAPSAEEKKEEKK